jgi:hypothetical protein
VYVVAVGQTVGIRLHGAIKEPQQVEPGVLRLVSLQQVGQSQLTARYRAVGVGFGAVGVIVWCRAPGCAAAERGARIAIASTTDVVHLTGADDGKTVRVKPGQAVEVRLDDRWDWVFAHPPTIVPVVGANYGQVGGVYLARGRMPEQIIATGTPNCIGRPAGGCPPANRTFRFTAATAT